MARKLSITKEGKVSIGKYDITVGGVNIEEHIIQDMLGIEDFGDGLQFYGKYTLTIEEIDEVDEVENTFGKMEKPPLIDEKEEV